MCNLHFAIITVVITILNGYICLCEVFHYLRSLPEHSSPPQGDAFTCSCVEIHFNVLNFMFGSKQICLRQLKSITSKTALPKQYDAVHICPHFKLCVWHDLIKTQQF